MPITPTLAAYEAITARCKDLFVAKMQDYGSAWRILRLPALTDQLMIKAQRIRRLQEEGYDQAVGEGVAEELVGILNYCVMALVQLALARDTRLDLPAAELLDYYDAALEENRTLLMQKNQDYNEIWRQMRISSITDIILMKILRIKRIEDNKGKTLVSEGVKGGYQDILNYAFFALVLLEEGASDSTQ